jgi:hypothetical protein
VGSVTGAREIKKEKYVQTVRKYEGEGLLGRLSSRWENIIKMDLK